MDMLAPMGPVYQAGTLSGNPVSMAAGLATLKILLKQNPYAQLAELGLMMADGLKSIQKNHPSFHFASLGSTFTVFFSREPVRDYSTARLCDKSKYAKFFHHMLNSGIFLPPSQFETCFISTAHTEKDISAFLSALETDKNLLSA
jgi:glutamate-1-semialdehyde 2,1-aminomutase